MTKERKDNQTNDEKGRNIIYRSEENDGSFGIPASCRTGIRLEAPITSLSIRSIPTFERDTSSFAKPHNRTKVQARLKIYAKTNKGQAKRFSLLSLSPSTPPSPPLLRRTTEFLLELSRTHHPFSCMYVVTSQTRQTIRLFGETVYQSLYMSLEKRFVSRVASFGKWTVPFTNSTLW